jgi:hypothetical protein
MRTIRVEHKIMDELKITEHNDVKKITVYMPKTSAISSEQTTSFYTSQRLNLSTRFVDVKTINDRQVGINSDHIILIEFGRLIELQNGFLFFLRENEGYEIIHQGNYGYTMPDSQIG